MKFAKRILVILSMIFLLSSTLVFPTSAAGRSIKTGVGFVTASTLRLRSAASTNSSTLAYASKNEVVIILEKSGSWYRVLYNLKEGYMHADHLSVSSVKNVELGYGEVNAAKVNMRSGPGTGYKAVGQSKQDDLAYVIGFNKQWYKVIWNGKICYIRSDYLDLIQSPYENKANPKSPLFFRSGKSTGTAVSVSALKNSANYIGVSGKQIVSTAKQYIGVPYLWAGETPKGFDCSGYTQYVFNKHGIRLNRTTTTQYKQGSYVSKSNLLPGDLVFFANTYREGISHVGIYVGDGKFIHASSSKGVTITPLSNPYWAARYYGARRIL